MKFNPIYDFLCCVSIFTFIVGLLENNGIVIFLSLIVILILAVTKENGEQKI